MQLCKASFSVDFYLNIYMSYFSRVACCREKIQKPPSYWNWEGLLSLFPPPNSFPATVHAIVNHWNSQIIRIMWHLDVKDSNPCKMYQYFYPGKLESYICNSLEIFCLFTDLEKIAQNLMSWLFSDLLILLLILKHSYCITVLYLLSFN